MATGDLYATHTEAQVVQSQVYCPSYLEQHQDRHAHSQSTCHQQDQIVKFEPVLYLALVAIVDDAMVKHSLYFPENFSINAVRYGWWLHTPIIMVRSRCETYCHVS